MSQLERNFATWKRTDLLKLCPMEDHLSVTMLAPNVNQNPECRRSPIFILNNPDNPWISSWDSIGRKYSLDQISNLSPSEKSVVLLSSLLLDTDFLSEVCLLIVAPFEC